MRAYLSEYVSNTAGYCSPAPEPVAGDSCHGQWPEQSIGKNGGSHYMKVLHVITDTNIGGAGRYLLNLLVQPAFDDISAMVACPGGQLAERLDNAGLKRVGISGKDVSFSVPLTFELRKIMREFRPDIVHTHSSLSGRIAARAVGIPVVYTKHNLVRIPSASGQVPPPAGPVKRQVNAIAAKLLSDGIIAVSQGVYGELTESGIDPSLVTCIPNGIDLAPYKPLDLLKKRQESEQILIGTVARLHPQKALEVMLEAARIVLASLPQAKFVIGGTGPLEESLKAKIHELRLEPYVKMVGFVEDVPGFLSQLDIYALSSDYEGLPLAVLEAMAAGLPIASTAVGGVPEAVVDGENGFLVSPRNSRLLAQSIVRLAVDPQLAAQMGAESRRRMEELFDAKIMARRTVQAYHKALKHRG